MNNYRIKIVPFVSNILNTNKDIIIVLPTNFNENCKYDIYLVFDGKELILNNEKNILTNNSNKIFIGISSTNNFFRFNDLSSYHNEAVKNLMTKHFPQLNNINITTLGGNGINYASFITNEVIPFLVTDFKIKFKTLNAIGCSMGAYFCLQMLYLTNLQFKKMILFSPAIWFNKTIMEDLTTKILNNNYPLTIILWVGKKEPKFFAGKLLTNYENNTIALQKNLINKNITTNIIIDSNGSHGFKWWINYMNENPLIF